MNFFVKDFVDEEYSCVKFVFFEKNFCEYPVGQTDIHFPLARRKDVKHISSRDIATTAKKKLKKSHRDTKIYRVFSTNKSIFSVCCLKPLSLSTYHCDSGTFGVWVEAPAACVHGCSGSSPCCVLLVCAAGEDGTPGVASSRPLAWYIFKSSIFESHCWLLGGLCWGTAGSARRVSVVNLCVVAVPGTRCLTILRARALSRPSRMEE